MGWLAVQAPVIGLCLIPRCRYKCVWEVQLQHKASGKKMTFGEHKGSPMVWTSPLSADFTWEDVLPLINLLVSPRCPHPYDGCVAGVCA